MRILKDEIEQRYWLVLYPTIIAARVRAIFAEDVRDRLRVIWDRPLTKDELKELNRLMEAA